MLVPVLAVWTALVISVSSAESGQSAQAMADRVANALRKTNSVSFYFVSRTGNYVLRTEQIKDEAALSITRLCGSNCHNLMDSVVSHIANSTPVKCSHGQENILISIGNELRIVYSNSGRVIRVEDFCYISNIGVDKIIKNSDFMFN